jgi:solute carrier family 13 (sodium-dependent dicarboxylate transporter), member 2/3/5
MGLEVSGLADWIGDQLSLLIGGTEVTPFVVFAVSAVMAFVISYAAFNTASAVITCPIAAALAIGAGVNPFANFSSRPCVLGFKCNPLNDSTMAIIYSSRVVRISNMFKTGMTSDLIRLTLLILIGPLLIDLLV